MRQNNQNKRMRGRSRKPSNPLSRTFESNGPDVKIRGTALHVAEKYVQLARDAQASGDRITAENYLQHAEHYFRIIAAAQGPSAIPNREDERSGEASSGNGSSGNGSSGNGSSGNGSTEREPSPVMAPDAPQPFVDAMPVADGKGGGNVRRKTDGSGAEKASGTRGKANGENKSEDAPVAQAEGAPEAEGEDGASKPKRRARGSRGRGGRKTTASEAGDDQGADQQDASSAPAREAAEAPVAEEAAEAPKKPARRTRKAAPKKDAAAETEAPSQEAVASEA